MPRYIEVEALYKRLTDNDVPYQADVADAIDTTPTADVVEVITNELTKRISGRLIQVLEANYEIIPKEPVLVRCKNCIHYKPSKADPSRKMCWRKDTDGFLVCYDFCPTDYCSYGERREE